MGAGLGAIGSGENVSHAPGYDGIEEGASAATVDPSGYVQTRGPILTDEGGFRCNYCNASVWVSIGPCGATNGSDTVYGQGFFADDLHIGDNFAISGQEAFSVQIIAFDDTTITLASPWLGSTVVGGAGVRAIVASMYTGDGTVTVVNGQALITSGVALGAKTGVFRSVDTLPLVGISRLTLSQRIVNQTFYLGFCDSQDPTLAKSFAWLAFDGTTVTNVKGQTGRNPLTIPTGGEIQTQTLTIATTAAAQEFRVEVLKDRVIFVMNGTVNNTNSISVPLASDHMYMIAMWSNDLVTPPASSSTATLDFIACNNLNEVATYPISREPQPVTVTGGTLAANQSVNVAQIGGTNTVNGGVAGTLSTGGVGADAAVLSGNSMLMGASDGTNKQRVRAAANNAVLPTAGNLTAITGYYNAAVQTYTSGNVAFLTTDRSGRQATFATGTTDPLLLGVTASTLDAAATTNATSLKATPGIVYEVSAVNNAAYDVFVKLANKATAPVPGTDIPFRVLRVPAGQTAQMVIPGVGLYFSTGIGYSATKLVGKLDATALVAGDVQFTIQWS